MTEPVFTSLCESAACVQTSTIGDEVTVRSSRDPDRTVVFDREEWAAFTAGLLPAGWQERAEWAYVSHWRDGTDHITECHDEDDARRRVSWGPADHRLVSHRSVARRRFLIEPWRDEDHG